MKGLLQEFKNHFDQLQDRMVSVCQHGVQTEGWFKAELLTLLDKFVKQKRIRGVDREVTCANGKIDLRIDTEFETNFIELKHWLIGKQKDYKYNPIFYFGDKSLGVFKDVEKLLSLPDEYGRWLLLLLSANPGIDAWNSGVAKFNEKFAPYTLTSQSDPSDYPETYFIGLVEVAISQ